MFLLKFHDHQEFEDFKVAETVMVLHRHIESLLGHVIKRQLVSKNCWRVLDAAGGEEIGFIGEVEVLEAE